ncbi:MAG: (Fe-S)-binding protein [Candidatus Lokiarchaeota archaeon]|nr:(Fe-S)-binding protein [Candidatus Lokiarchaeota archaeon]
MRASSKLEPVKKYVYICARCNSCKLIYHNGERDEYMESCPAGSYFVFEPYWASGKNLMARALIEGEYEMTESTVQKIYSCILCGQCESCCQQDVSDHLVEVFEALRAEAVASGLGPLPAHRTFKENIDKQGNPYGEPADQRFAEEYIKKHVKDKADVVYFMGCTAAYREKDLVKHTVSVLEKMGIDFAILKDETCCGSPLITTGQVDAARSIAEKNIAAVTSAGAKVVVTSCAGCFRTWATQYEKKFGLTLPFKVQHITEYLKDNIKKLKFKAAKPPIKVTYHDPCHLGRHGGVYEAPREVLKRLPGIDLVEMPRNRKNAWCCGAGAGVKSAIKDLALETAKKRIAESEGTGASLLVTACPFCERNLGDAIKAASSTMAMKDIVALVDEMIS